VLSDTRREFLDLGKLIIIRKLFLTPYC
jgi:hypothetical protein